MENDYCSSVYAWFERCGIISDVRTHLRHNLVHLLKNKDLTLNKAKIPPQSAKQYVYDLLIADYLWNHNYAYTLSVFASEAPLLINFHRHVVSQGDEHQDKHKLQNDYVCHTLETLGIQPNQPNGQSIIAEYANNDIPLLLSILKHQTKTVQKVQEKITRNSGCQTEFSKGDLKYISATMEKLVKQKETFDGQLREKKNQLKKRAGAVEQQMVLVNDKLSRVQIMMEEVNAKKKEFEEEKKREEDRLYVKQLELSVKENALSREAERLEKERDNRTMFEENFKKLEEELAKMKEDLPQRDNLILVSRKEISTQTDGIDDKKKLDDDREKQEMQLIIKEQKIRIKELSQRALSLSQELEEAHQARQIANDISQADRRQTMKTILSESSSTDEIIQDAKKRLKRLKEETFKADQCYFNSIVTLPLS